jgi:hypothetical protein
LPFLLVQIADELPDVAVDLVADRSHLVQREVLWVGELPVDATDA